MELENEGVQTLVAHGKINPSNLKRNQYMISLLHEALRVELLNRQEANQIQVQLMLILKEVMLRYTKGESSSVTTETAESLLLSILYAMDAYTLSCSSPEEAIRHLQSMPLNKVYEKGVERIAQWFEETKKLYKEIRKNKLNIPLEAYQLTICEGIPLFFKKYGIIFDSHNTMASIDYPLALDDTSIQGVLYMKHYLEHLKLENEFCKYFSTKDIEKVLSDFGRMIRMDYKIELINLFEMVFNNAVFSVLAGGNAAALLLSKSHFDRVNRKLRSFDSVEISQGIEGAIERLIGILNITRPELVDYIHRYKPVFIERVVNAARNDSLSSIIIFEKEDRRKANTLVFKEGERMSDDSFKGMIKKLMKLASKEDKIDLIKSGICSLYDFMDILNSDCLFGDEFEALFDALGDMELAILASMVFYEELRGNSSGLASILLQEKEVEHEWQKRYIEFVQKLGENRVVRIENCFGEIEYEEITFY